MSNYDRVKILLEAAEALESLPINLYQNIVDQGGQPQLTQDGIDAIVAALMKAGDS